VVASFTLFMHSSLGIETIMEDYIHNDSMQRFFINLSKAIHVILFLVTLISLSMIRGS
jgi:succinate dehydrogenase hydrophobic anchor subunit